MVSTRQKIDDLRRALIDVPIENIRDIITQPRTTVPTPSRKIKDIPDKGFVLVDKSDGIGDGTTGTTGGTDGTESRPSKGEGRHSAESIAQAQRELHQRALAEQRFRESQRILEKQKQQAETRKIRNEEIRKQQEAKQVLDAVIKSSKTPKQRQQAVQQFQQNIQLASAQARQQRKEVRIIKGVTPTQARRDERVLKKVEQRKREEEKVIEREVVIKETPTPTRTPEQQVVDFEVAPFDPTKSEFIKPTRRELGAQKSFINIIKEPKKLATNIFKSLIGKGDLIMERDRKDKTIVQRIPTGTIIDDSKTFKTEFTTRDILDIEAVLGGGAGTPTEFIIQNIGDKIITKTQQELNKKTTDTNLTEEQKQKIQNELQIKAEKEFSKQVSNNPTLKNKLKFDKSLQKFRDSQKVNVGTAIQLGFVGGAVALSGATGGVSLVPLLAVGGYEFLSSVEEPTTKAKLTKQAEGLLDIGFGLGAFKVVSRGIDKLAFKELSEAPVLIGGEETFRGALGSKFEVRALKEVDEIGRVLATEDLNVFRVGEKGFRVTGGKAKVRTEFFSFEKGEVLRDVGEIGIQARGELLDIAKLTEKTITKDLRQVTELKSFRGAVGEGIIVREAELEAFKFGGIAKQLDDFDIVFGGAVKGVRGKSAKTELEFFDKVVRRGRMPLTKEQALIEPKIFGTIKTFKEPEADLGFKVISPKPIKKTPLSKTFKDEGQVLEEALKQTTRQDLGTSSIPSLSENVLKSELKQVSKKLPKTISPISRTKVTTKVLLDTDLDEGLITRTRTKQIGQQKLEQDLSPLLTTTVLTDVLTDQDISQATAQDIAQKQELKQDTKLRQTLTTPTLPTPTRQPLPKLKTDLGFKLPPFLLPPLPRGKRRVGGRGMGYNVSAKRIKSQKFKKLNKVPITKSLARDLGSQVVDESLGRRFKTTPTKRQAQTPRTKIIRGNFARTINKFRDFEQVKGKRKKLKNEFIELGRNLLDTPQEKKKITIARRVAQLRKPKQTNDLLITGGLLN